MSRWGWRIFWRGERDKAPNGIWPTCQEVGTIILVFDIMMIDSRELRIDNILLFNNQIAVVKGVFTGHVYLDGVLRITDNPIYPNDYREISVNDPAIRPLPLGDSIIRLFFSSIHDDGGGTCPFGEGGNYWVFHEGDSFFVGMNLSGEIVHIIPHHIVSFHELQNAYYTIHGEDLPVDVDSLRMKWNRLQQK